MRTTPNKDAYASPTTRVLRVETGRMCYVATSGNHQLQNMDVNELLDEDF